MQATLYTWTSCPFCIHAKALLDQRGIEYTEHVMDGKAEELEEIKQRYGHWTVPIVLIDDEFVGGCDDLMRLDREGRLTTA